MIGPRRGTGAMTLGRRFWQINWFLIFLITALACVGFAMLYSAADGNYDPWASRQATRFVVGLGVMLMIALTDIRLWLRHAYLFYAVALGLLIAVEFAGSMGMGAQRWIDLKFIRLQPSELMKITMVLALARYFHRLSLDDVARPVYLLFPLVLVAAPTVLVLRQPDLGTAILLTLGGGVMFFLEIEDRGYLSLAAEDVVRKQISM